MTRFFLPLVLMAAPVTAVAGPLEDRAALGALQADDARLQSIGWRLVRGNAAYCADARPAIGLLLQDMAGYAQPGRMRGAAGIAGDIAVQAVAAGAPAAQAGLAPNHEILAIGSRLMRDLPPSKANDWRRLAGLHDAIDAELAREGAVRVVWRDGGATREARIAGVPACPTRFELLDSGGRAVADGTRVLFGRKFAGFGLAEDEIAAAVAHELAHNLLHHRAWLRTAGRSAKNIRRTEREADRLMPWLLVNAGHDPAAAVRFFRKWGPGNDGWIFRAPTHDGWDERAGFVAAELAKIAAYTALGKPADWRTGFTRETGG